MSGNGIENPGFRCSYLGNTGDNIFVISVQKLFKQQYIKSFVYIIIINDIIIPIIFLYLWYVGIKKLNEIAIPLATSHGFLIFDYYKLRIPFPNDGDGELYYYHILDHHY